MIWREGPDLKYGRGSRGLTIDGHFFHPNSRLLDGVNLYEPIYNDWIVLKFNRSLPDLHVGDNILPMSEGHGYTCP